MSEEMDFTCPVCKTEFTTSGYGFMFNESFPLPVGAIGYCPHCQAKVVRWYIRRNNVSETQPTTDNV